MGVDEPGSGMGVDEPGSGVGEPDGSIGSAGTGIGVDVSGEVVEVAGSPPSRGAGTAVIPATGAWLEAIGVTALRGVSQGAAMGCGTTAGTGLDASGAVEELTFEE